MFADAEFTSGAAEAATGKGAVSLSILSKLLIIAITFSHPV
jgi:hypothetical protein|tara:strand:- start:347 stop:469 length:123 start_codon:yes stop_codon:yes gene_type:complete